MENIHSRNGRELRLVTSPPASPRPQQILDHIQHVASVFHLSALTSQIETYQQLLASDGPIDVAVFGRFKAGKSSFLNHLAGIEVLPVGVVPVTSVITKLSFGEQPHVGIHYLDGAVSTVALQKIAEFVSEAHNPENKKGVASVVVTLPQLAPYKGLTFVDTPGVGSVFQHNTLTSMDWLARVGAAIVAVSVDPPLTEGDLQLLRELQRFTPKIVVLLTKADLLRPEELDEVTVFVRTQITEKVGLPLTVLPFSIKENTALFRAALDAELLSPLIAQGATHKERILHYKLASLLQQLVDYLAIAKKAAETSEHERDALRLRIMSEKQEGPLFKENLLFLRNKLLVEARPHILARLLAETALRGHRIEEGLAAVTEALEQIQRTGERFSEAEVYRLQGELLLLQEDTKPKTTGPKKRVIGPEACFHQAITVARRQRAKLYELRATVSLGRLWHRQGKRRDAHRMLSEIYNWFTEGFETVDLQEAKALLDDLA